MIKLWGRTSSSNVQAVLWCLSELDLAYSRIDAGFTFGVVNTEAYLAMNPNATVPTLQDADLPALWESGAIVRYLASRYGTESFWPKAHEKRAIVDQWAEWSKVNVAANFTSPIFWQVVRTPAARQNAHSIQAAVARLTGYLEIADRQLARYPYLAGDKFSLADIQFGHCLYRYFDIDIKRKPLDHLKSLLRYVDPAASVSTARHAKLRGSRRYTLTAY